MAAAGAILAAAAQPGDFERHAGTVARILEEGQRGRSYEILQHLTDRIGHRLSGSPGAAKAVEWTAARLREDGLEVRLEPVMVPHWVRGEESAEIVAPAPQRLLVTALGGSEPTPEGGVTAEVVVAPSLAVLRAMDPAVVRGKIVLMNRAMVAESRTDGYAQVVEQRSRGASEAARKGAVASLIRSVGTLDARLVHTGSVTYAADAPRIPAGAITAEDADLIARLAAGGTSPTVRLRLGCRTLPDAPSHNVVADLRGRERPQEIVILAAHLDSWDLGTGAHDDGAGVAMVMDALRLLKAHGLVPRRTLRGILYMNEENGLRGARQYAADHAAELPLHVAAIEADSGGFRPEGFNSNVSPAGLETLRAIASLLAPIGATGIVAGGGGADIGALRPAAVPLLGLDVEGSRYFHWHHTPADTLDKVDRGDLARGTAAMAAMGWLLAEVDLTLPRPSPSPSASPAAR
jgi:hypothetical protein